MVHVGTTADSSLDGLFKAEGIAIIGASSKVGKPGNKIVEYALEMDYKAGSFEIDKGAFRQAGVIQTFNVPEFYHTAAAFSKMPMPKGNRVCVLTRGHSVWMN